ncbi:hypothetical protein GGH99_005268, partial [Coemansia sp. RSA 1285]
MSENTSEDVQGALEKYRRRRRELEQEEEEEGNGQLQLGIDNMDGTGRSGGLGLGNGKVEAYVPSKQRRIERMENIRQKLHYKSGQGPQSDTFGNNERTSEAEKGSDSEDDIGDDAQDILAQQGPNANVSLVDQMAELRKKHLLNDKTKEEKESEQEKALLAAIARRKQLASAAEIAKGVVYRAPMRTNWRPLLRHRELSPKELNDRRKLWHIIADGENIPPPLVTFKSMRFPKAILDYLKSKGIVQPSPIQMQGLPVALSGRDMIGIASTGTGKTMAFSLPLIMLALEEECRCPLIQGEGPIGLIVCPSRELARQTYNGLLAMAEALKENNYPELRAILAIGGISMQDQFHTLSKGVHMVVATPGRLQDMLNKGKINLDLCKYMCMDEADRMIDVGFEEETRNIMSFFKHQRQTVLFSATMPKKIQDFAQSSL